MLTHTIQHKNESALTNEARAPEYTPSQTPVNRVFPDIENTVALCQGSDDRVLDVCDLVDRSEMIEMASRLRTYLQCDRWNIDPALRRQAQTALSWMEDRRAAPLILRLGVRLVLSEGWPGVLEDMQARLKALELADAERQLLEASTRVDVHVPWRQVSRVATMMRKHQGYAGLSSFMEPSMDPLHLSGCYMPPRQVEIWHW